MNKKIHCNTCIGHWNLPHDKNKEMNKPFKCSHCGYFKIKGYAV